RLALVGAQDQLAELGFLLRQRLLALLRTEPATDVEVGLALVASEVEQFEGAKRLVGGLELALHADQALASSVNRELAQISADPFATKPFCYSGRGPRPNKKICHKIALIRR